MTTAELDPAHIPGGLPPIPNPEPLRHQRICVTPAPPATHPPFVEGNFLTHFDPPLHDTRLGQRTRKNPGSNEYQVAESHSPPSAREETKQLPVTGGSSHAALDALLDVPPSHLHQHFAHVADDVLSSINNLNRPQHPARSPKKPINDEFSLSGLQTLQTFIPKDLFPDDLLVHDPDNITNLWHNALRPPNLPVRYVRIFPNFKASPEPFPPYLQLYPDSKEAHERHMPPPPAFLHRSPAEPARVAHLYLKAENTVGKGHHSSVFSAPLRLRLGLDPQSGVELETTVRVAAKTARGTCGAHTMLNVEASVYNAFPRHLMDDQYVCAASGASGAAEGTGSIEPAVVPKFFGYYAAVAADGRVITPLHATCGPDAACPVAWPTRILLIEECGQPIVPQAFTREQKLHCLHLVKRLHAAGFAQNSMYNRNILVQPGPLRSSPAMRSYAAPSFRIIDFGRGVALAHLPPSVHTFPRLCHGEQWRAAYRVLGVCSRAERNDADADADWGAGCTNSKVERGALETVMCRGYAGLISLHMHVPGGLCFAYMQSQQGMCGFQSGFQ